MKKETAITILQEYNQWRRGENMMISMPNTKDIGEAIDEAIKVLKDSRALAVEPEIERKTGWYVVDQPGWEDYISYEDLENNIRYGLTSNGDWFTGSISEVDWSHMIPATKHQIHTKIGEYIRNRGYKAGVQVKSMVTGTHYTLDDSGLEFNDWSRCVKFGGITIMRNGEWSKIVKRAPVEGLKSSSNHFENEALYSLINGITKTGPFNICNSQSSIVMAVEDFNKIVESFPEDTNIDDIARYIFSQIKK